MEDLKNEGTAEATAEATAGAEAASATPAEQKTRQQYIHNVDLHECTTEGIPNYFASHRDLQGLHATTSCYSVWKDHGNTNAFAKVIPAPPAGEKYVCFFFDDNIDLSGGMADSAGITNLRAANTGEFIAFAEGHNGYGKPERIGRNSEVAHSAEFQTVLVKVCILDAMMTKSYFTDIIEKFTIPDHKIVAYVDINSTVVFGDIMTGKDKEAVLLSTMYETFTLDVTEPFEVKWEDCEICAVKTGKIPLKKLVKKVTENADPCYKHFWNLEKCKSFLKIVLEHGTITSGKIEMPIDEPAFIKMHLDFIDAMETQSLVSKNGIVESWYKLYDKLRKDHLLMLNTFGVDSRSVVRSTLEKFDEQEREASLTVVNYDRWSTRDMLAFEKQYEDMFKDTDFRAELQQKGKEKESPAAPATSET